ncbi:hypothetical protein [Elizabethkingia anophelis]|uniref:hypothetical protein n=1 Tax=Elizabethkingia anophelis TaxID=1117645 RepID=UPI001625C93D|nr:hypothetical protein [Elizabethkingia anophelis]MDV4116276.1 hypothetical protein [Elizabethkingia anophelis]
MKLVFAGILTLMAFLFVQEHDDVIVWDASRPLTWDDFQGVPQKRFTAASTSYNIWKAYRRKEQSKLNVEITAVFLKNKSWKKHGWMNVLVLEHEQKHFDIAELFARKLRKKMATTSYTSEPDFVSKFNSFYTDNDLEMDVFQDRYDEETDGSLNGDKQREWNRHISAELKSLEAYRDKELIMTINEKL